jgi:selenocysteine-specific elongation factor
MSATAHGRARPVHVVATAGHVDHGKSTLVRALTGIEPDRWEEEHRRGLTIDLGYAWTTLDSGEPLAFVDVPGHERFIGNMLAGIGPVPAVLFVVAADEGWRQQSAEHLAAVDALGVAHGLLVVTRSDLADPGPALADAQARLAATSLGSVESVAVSARTGEGMDALRAALSRLVATLPAPRTEGRTRLWVDRAFTIRGSGTVVTGTLAEGSLSTGDVLELRGREVRVRGLQSLERPVTVATPVCRVAANLRGLTTAQVARGDVLLTPGAWRATELLDVRVRGVAVQDLPGELVLHVGTAAVGARVRPLGVDTARLSLRRPLFLVSGDRAILRDPGSRAMAGALVLDADPPALRRRGAAVRRAAELEAYTGVPDLAVEVGRRGAMQRVDAQMLGIVAPQGDSPESVVTVGAWYVAAAALEGWADALRQAVATQTQAQPLEPSLAVEAARAAAGVPDRSLMQPVVERAQLELRQGRVGVPGAAADLGPAEAGLRAVEQRLAATPFAAPERPELAESGLGPRQLAAAERVGRLVRLGDDVVLLPDAPARAMRELAALPQPFTLSQARQALGTTRRVAVPLLEHLDRRGWTRRVDDTHREVVR